MREMAISFVGMILIILGSFLEQQPKRRAVEPVVQQPALYVPVQLNPPNWVRVVRVEGADGCWYKPRDGDGTWMIDYDTKVQVCVGHLDEKSYRRPKEQSEHEWRSWWHF